MLIPQFELIYKTVELMNLPCIMQEGYEAVGIEMSDAYFQRSTERLKTALESEVNQN